MKSKYRIVKVDKRNLAKLKFAINIMNLETNAHSIKGDGPESGSKYKIHKLIGGYLAYYRGEIVGWGACFDNCCEAHVFTHHLYRRRGIGTRIVKRFTRDYPYLLFCPWNRRVQGFFNKRRVNYSIAYL